MMPFFMRIGLNALRNSKRTTAKLNSSFLNTRLIINQCLNLPGCHKDGIADGRRWHMGHAYHHHGDGSGERVSKLGLVADIGLASGKALVGYLSGSTAIIADAAHSVSDVVLSGVAWWSLKAARTPKDDGHPYGHGKYETLGALSISVMLLATGSGIAWHALEVLQGLLVLPSPLDVHSLTHAHANNHEHAGHHHGIDMDHPILALNTAIISIAIKEGFVP